MLDGSPQKRKNRKTHSENSGNPRRELPALGEHLVRGVRAGAWRLQIFRGVFWALGLAQKCLRPLLKA